MEGGEMMERVREKTIADGRKVWCVLAHLD